MSIRITKYGAISTRAQAETVETALDVYQESGTKAACEAAGVHPDSVTRWAKHFGLYRPAGPTGEAKITDWIALGERLVRRYGPAEGNVRLLSEWTKSVVPGVAA